MRPVLLCPACGSCPTDVALVMVVHLRWRRAGEGYAEAHCPRCRYTERHSIDAIIDMILHERELARRKRRP